MVLITDIRELDRAFRKKKEIKIMRVSIEERKRLRAESIKRLENRPPSKKKRSGGRSSKTVICEFKCDCGRVYKERGKSVENAKLLEVLHKEYDSSAECNGKFTFSREITNPCNNCGASDWDIMGDGRMRCIGCGSIDTDKIICLFGCVRCNATFQKEFDDIEDAKKITGLHESDGCGGDVRFLMQVIKPRPTIINRGEKMVKLYIGIPEGETDNVRKVCEDLKKKNTKFDYEIEKPMSETKDKDGLRLSDKFENLLVIKSDSEYEAKGFGYWFIYRCENAKLSDYFWIKA